MAEVNRGTIGLSIIHGDSSNSATDYHFIPVTDKRQRQIITCRHCSAQALIEIKEQEGAQEDFKRTGKIFIYSISLVFLIYYGFNLPDFSNSSVSKIFITTGGIFVLSAVMGLILGSMVLLVLISLKIISFEEYVIKSKPKKHRIQKKIRI